VGGSLAGLFAGIVLKRLGHNVRILERSATSLLQTQGAGIVAGGDTQAFFQRHDLTKTPIAAVSKLRHYLGRQGQEIDRDEREQKMTSWDLLYNILRANFDGGGDRSYCDVPSGGKNDGQAVYEVDCIVTSVHETGNNEMEVAFHSHSDTEGKQTATSDLVIAADGASSTIRNFFNPTPRQYAGYVAWRGTVPESVITASYPAAAEAFIEKFTFYHSTGLQILAYIIPGPGGTLKPGERLLNFVWYCNYAEGSDEWRDLMTDVDGKLNSTTLHAGKMRPEIWQRQKKYAREVLPPQFADLVCATKEPFVQAISDVISDSVMFANGKVICVGDAVAGFRPHTAASTTQAARHALGIEEVMKGNMSWDEWQQDTLRYASDLQRSGVSMGDRSQFGRHPLSS